MPQLSDGLKRKIQANRSTFLVCMIAAFSWGLLAHAYVFLNSIISHDSLAEFNAVLLGNEFKIKSGRRGLRRIGRRSQPAAGITSDMLSKNPAI